MIKDRRDTLSDRLGTAGFIISRIGNEGVHMHRDEHSIRDVRAHFALDKEEAGKGDGKG